MRTLGNVIWFICGGIWAGLGWWIAGIICYIGVITIPFGIACFRIAQFAFFPFGKELVDARLLGEKVSAMSTLGNVLWFVLCGWWVAAVEVICGLACLVSCIFVLPVLLGAPAWAIAHFKLASVALFPLGKRIVTVEEAQHLRKMAAERKFSHLAR
ncbi:YccF family protein [Thermogutta sp.]|uniref:YccF domain-containing protein n=1 Tax=Thermogutta sp. TaxID=1962930 RepID=UPI00321FF8F9